MKKPEPNTPAALRNRVALLLCAAAIAWAVIAIWLVPALIRSAYVGEAPAFLNRFISGQAQHPVDRYLTVWTRAAWRLTAVLAGFGLVGFAIAYNADRIAPRARPLLGSWLPRLRVVDVLAAATCIGVLSGLAEAGVAVWRRNVKYFPTGYFVNAEVYWMTPLAAVATFALLGLLLVAADRAIRARGLLLGLAPPAFAGLAVFSLARALTFGIGVVPALLLALGAATALARVTSSRAHLTRRLFRRAAAAWVASLLILAAVIPLWRSAVLSRTLAALPPASADAPNVLIIIWDAVRALNLSLYGYDRATTPELERFAQHGAVFERAFATAPWSLPSHASMFTGRYPTELTAARQAPLDDTYPTLAEVLTEKGYATGGFTANNYYGSASWGIARGFTTYLDVPRVRPGLVASTWWLSRTARGQLQRRTMKHAPGPLKPTAVDVNRSLLRWIDERGDRPFFAVINHFEAHDPYLPPEPFNRAFSAVQPRFWLDEQAIQYSEDDLRQLATAYDTSIRYLDYELGRLLDALRDRGVLDNTLVIVTSDHGEQFGEHAADLVKHAWSLYTPVLHVPLVVVAPWRVPPGVRRSEPVSIRDIPATVVDMLGMSTENPFPGTSLLRYADDSITPQEAAEPRLSVAERGGMVGIHPTWPVAAGHMFSLVAGDLHYILNGDEREELYNLSSDIWEQHDLAAKPEVAHHLARFRAALDSIVPSENGARRAFLPRDRGAAGPRN